MYFNPCERKKSHPGMALDYRSEKGAIFTTVARLAQHHHALA